jgi:hypothetical protein
VSTWRPAGRHASGIWYMSGYRSAVRELYIGKESLVAAQDASIAQEG